MSHKIMYCYVRLSKCQALKYKLYISCLTTSSEFLPNCMYIHFCYFNKRKEVKQFTSHIPGHELENVKAKFEASHSGQNDSRHRASGKTKSCHLNSPVTSLSVLSETPCSLCPSPFHFLEDTVEVTRQHLLHQLWKEHLITDKAIDIIGT